MTRGDSILALAADIQLARANANETLAVHGPDSILTSSAALELRRLERFAAKTFA